MRRTVVPLLWVVLVSAGPREERTPDELVRAGNAAVARGDYDAAVTQYTAAEERTLDPGLVAFNKANALYLRGQFAEAERYFTRSLDDLDAPTDRRCHALYNRGVCLIRQGGLSKLRTAIDSLERCLQLNLTDEGLLADARHNLELAKLLWVEARAKERKRPLPSDPADDEPPAPRPPQPELGTYDPFNPENGGMDPGRQFGGAEPIGRQPNGGNLRMTDQQTGGKGNQPVLANADKLPEWNDRQVREYLDQLSGRLARDRRDTAALTAPAERPNVKDW